MKDLVKKYGYIFVILACLPIVSFIPFIGQLLHLSEWTMIAIQIPALSIQIFSLFIIIIYRKEVYE